MKETRFSTEMMKKVMTSGLILLMAALFVLPANAAYSVGPNDPVIGFPSYYVDSNGLAIQPCLAGDKNCIPAPQETFDGIVTYDPKLPIVFPTATTVGNFPSETFYWVADAKSINMGPTGTAKLVFRMALEGAFATLSNPPGRPTPGQQIMFARINMKRTLGLTPLSTYTVTWPYGVFTFTTDTAGTSNIGVAGQAFRTQDPIVPLALNFGPILQTTNTNLGPFLKATAQNPPPAGYLGNPLGLQVITAGPNGNFVQIDGPNIGGIGKNTITTNQWTLAGKIMTPGVTMSVNPSTITTGAATPANYILTITNTGTAADKFNLAVQGAAGATATLDASSIILGAGTSGTVTLSVASASPGPYLVGVTATSSVTPTVSASISTTTTVGGINPTIAMLLPGETQKFSDLQPSVVWSESSLGAVGTIDPVSGLFTAVAPGTTTVSATGAAVDTATVIVGLKATIPPIPLVAGYNLIVVPVQPDVSFTANKLLQLIAAQNTNVAGLKVARWNATSQGYEIFDSVAGVTDFPIEANRPYFIKVSAGPAGVRIVGT